jgi:hypothetical protein
MMKFVGTDESELIMVTALDRDGDKLVIKGKVFGAMPITARLSPAEARRGLRLLNFRLWLFLLTFLLRR